MRHEMASRWVTSGRDGESGIDKDGIRIGCVAVVGE